MEDKLMNSLPTTTYDQEKENNDKQMQKIMEQIFPGVSVPYEFIYQIITFITETGVNAQILPKVIRGVYNVSIGTGQGQIVIHVNGDKVNVSVRETDSEIKTKT
jgi:hypothetical protein